MDDPSIRPDLAQAAGPMLLRWNGADLATVGRHLGRFEVVVCVAGHRSGVVVLTTGRIFIQSRDESAVSFAQYQVLDDVETGSAADSSWLVVRSGSDSAVVSGMTEGDVQRVVQKMRSMAAVRTPPQNLPAWARGDRNPAARTVPADLFTAPQHIWAGGPETALPPGVLDEYPAAEPPPWVDDRPYEVGPETTLPPGVLDAYPVEEPPPWVDDRPYGVVPATAELPDEPAPGPGLGTFEVHALGPSGAGKTVYMAALYAQMRIRRPSSTFHLRSDFASSSRLNAVYNEIQDVAGAWPQSTTVSAEWEFTACMRSDTGDFEPMRFRYLDYPGGILTNPRGAEMPQVQANIARLRNANALLILLDGQAVAALMEGDPSGRRYLSFDLTSSLEIAQQSRCPIHFVITKWDVLARRYTLEQVRAQLLADYNFRDLVEARAQDSSATIRLIPVSAVGFDYATPAPDGSMRKLGGRPRPYNVEIPLVSVLPDFLTLVHATVARQREELAATPEPQAEGRMSAAVRKGSAMAVHAAVKRWFPLFGLVPTSVVEQAIGFGDRLLARRSRSGRAAAEARDELLSRRRAVTSELAAVDLLMQECAQVVEEFERAHPASVLTGGLIAAEARAAAS